VLISFVVDVISANLEQLVDLLKVSQFSSGWFMLDKDAVTPFDPPCRSVQGFSILEGLKMWVLH